MQNMYEIMRAKDVMKATGLSKVTIWRMVRKGLFTQPVRLGERISGWPVDEIEKLNKAFIAGQQKNEIRILVKQLMEHRVS